MCSSGIVTGANIQIAAKDCKATRFNIVRVTKTICDNRNPGSTITRAPYFSGIRTSFNSGVEVAIEFNQTSDLHATGITIAVGYHTRPGIAVSGAAAPYFRAVILVASTGIDLVVEHGKRGDSCIVDIAESVVFHLCPGCPVGRTPNLSCVTAPANTSIELTIELDHINDSRVGVGASKAQITNGSPGRPIRRAPDARSALPVGGAGIELLAEHLQRRHTLVPPVAKPIDVHLLPPRHAGGEFLDAVVAPVGYVDVALGIHINTTWLVELANFAAPSSSNSGQIGPAAVKDLHAGVVSVCHIDASRSVYGHVAGPTKVVKVIPTFSCRAYGVLVDVVAVKDLHAIIIPVGHIDVPVGVYEHTSRAIKVSVVCTGRTRHAQGSHIDPTIIVNLDAVIPGVGHVNIPVRAYGHAAWISELIVAVPLTSAECDNIVASAVIDLHAVIILVCHVDVTAAVYSHTCRPTEVSIVRACDTRFPNRPLWHSARVEFQQTVATFLREDNVARTVYGDTVGPVKVVIVGDVGHAGSADGVLIDAAAVELLHTEVVLVRDVNVAIGIHSHIFRAIEVNIVRAGDAGLAQRGDVIKAAVKDLHAVVAGIGHVDVAVGIYDHVTCTVEMSVIPTGFARCPQGGAVVTAAIEDLHAVVTAVGDVDVAAGVHGQPVGAFEVGVVRTGDTALTQCGTVDAATIKDLHPVITVVGDVDVACAVKGDGQRGV